MGNAISQIYPPKPVFAVEQIPDLAGQIVIVTGGNAGVGKETCKALLSKNAKVYLAARSRPRAEEAIEWLKNELYAQSKIGNVLFSNELAKQYGDQGIISVSLNPGNLKTELGRHLTRLHIWLLEFILYPASYGALTQLWAGTTPDIEQLNGKFLIPWARIGDAGAFARDEQLAKKLWNWCEEQVKGHSTM
ncbi:short chain dehydrogenase [Ceratobasidium sp. AG-Ba]|nr:short chain dehydrogenase [Ceratobasidium sp. AG-Ba]